MPNDSSTGGYLPPAVAPAPLEGQALLDFIQEVIVGVTGLNGTLVRPRWLSEPSNIPAAAVAWCAFGIMDRPSDTYPYVQHVTNLDYPNGADLLQRQEELQILASFYDLGSTGLADKYASILRDGLSIAQNREVLQVSGYALAYTGQLQPVPSLLQERWLYRVDLSFTVRRQINRAYPILNLDASGIQIVTDEPPTTTDINVEET